MMSNIVRLEPPVKTGSQKAAADGLQTTAEIVIFPGIRYERWGAMGAENPATTQTSASQRDLIEL